MEEHSLVARWRPLGLSLAAHASVLAVFASGWWLLRAPPEAPKVMAIEAFVAEPTAFAGTRRAPPAPTPPAPVPAPAAPEPVEPAEPTRSERKAELERKAAAERKAVADRKAADQRKAADARRVAEERKAAAERKAAEERKAAADRRAAEEARIRSEREADLKRQLEAEERGMAARASGAGAQWAAAIQARIQRAWIRPPSARAGLDCTVAVTQVPGGEIVAVRVLQCNGDAVVRQSIEDAVLRASPLPPPPDPALFERNIEVRFRPND